MFKAETVKILEQDDNGDMVISYSEYLKYTNGGGKCLKRCEGDEQKDY